jgi:prepilin-type N-terminal cleavage/methylation domain-containing protein
MLRGASARRADIRGHGDDGFSVVEMIIAMLVFGIFSTAALSMTISMMHVTTRSIAIADTSMRARAVLGGVGRVLPAASTVNSPTRVGNDWYVEALFPPKLGAGSSTCTQWRLVASADQIQVRSWNTINAIPSVWKTLADHAVNDPTAQPPFTVLAPDAGFGSYRVTFDLYVTAAQGAKVHEQNEFALRNSSSVAAGTVCTEVGRP